MGPKCDNNMNELQTRNEQNLIQDWVSMKLVLYVGSFFACNFVCVVFGTIVFVVTFFQKTLIIGNM
jgi:hypothetical protein